MWLCFGVINVVFALLVGVWVSCTCEIVIRFEGQKKVFIISNGKRCPANINNITTQYTINNNSTTESCKYLFLLLLLLFCLLFFVLLLLKVIAVVVVNEIINNLSIRVSLLLSFMLSAILYCRAGQTKMTDIIQRTDNALIPVCPSCFLSSQRLSAPLAILLLILSALEYFLFYLY